MEHSLPSVESFEKNDNFPSINFFFHRAFKFLIFFTLFLRKAQFAQNWRMAVNGKDHDVILTRTYMQMGEERVEKENCSKV